MLVTFWGVRGSTPVCGADTLRYGGNTSCVSIEAGGRILVIDAGTGIRRLGQTLVGDKREVFLALTHLHGDHIIGFPFFAPLYERGSRMHLLDYRHGGTPYSLIQLFDGVHVPMHIGQVATGWDRPQEATETYLARHGFDTATIPLNHPGGALGYRISDAGRTFVFITDNELAAPEITTTFEQFAAFCRGADVLVHDAQWIEGELPARAGWGHSTVAQACELAIAAGVRCLVLFHHDPDRSDDAIDALQADARRVLTPHGIECTAAFEGLRFELSAAVGPFVVAEG
jgi:phosphoribosyl 1,2-cyclic phosphodiesterase